MSALRVEQSSLVKCTNEIVSTLLLHEKAEGQSSLSEISCATKGSLPAT